MEVFVWTVKKKKKKNTFQSLQLRLNEVPNKKLRTRNICLGIETKLSMCWSTASKHHNLM